MKTQTSKTRMWLSSLLLLPIIAILFYSFAERVEIKKDNSENNQIQNSLNDTNEIDDPEYLHYTVQTFQVKDDETGLYVSKSFTELPEYYKRKWIYTPATPYYKKQITKTEFNSLSNSKKYLILIDGNTIQNSELNNYNSTDFVTYSNSTISELAEMEQQYVYNLITKEGLEIFTKLAIISFNNALDDYNDLLNYVENGNPKTIQKLEDDYKFMKQLYERLTPEIIVSNNLKLPQNPFQKEHQETERTKQDPPVMWILINRNDQLLVDDEVGTLKSIESKLKTLRNQGKSGQPVSIKYDEETSKEMISKVEKLIEINKFKVASFNISPVMFILINRKDLLLVDDEPGTINSIENRLKTLAQQGESGRQVFIKYDKETSKGIISKVEDLIKANDFKVASFDISTIPPAPPLPEQKQEIATVKQVAAYNDWAKAINQQMAKAKETNDVNAYPIVKVKDVKKYKAIYDLMSDAQRKDSEPWPSFPPPPPRPPAPKQTKGGPIEINGTTYYFTQQNGKTTYYDNYGKVVDINKIPPPPPIPNNATPEQKAKMKKATEAYMKANPDKVGKAIDENGETIEVIEVPEDLQGSIDINGETFYYTTSNGKTTYYNGSGKEVKMDNLPPPPPTPPAPKSTTKTEDSQNKTTFYSKTTDIKALNVTEKRTEYDGIYYHYEIKNTGNTIIQANSYSVFLKVNGKTISFDKATSELKPGQTLKYKSEKTFYKKDHDVLNYSLEIKMDDSNLENNILKGQSKF